MENDDADYRNWQLGIYISHAVSLIGKGKYPEKPLFQSNEITEEKGDSSSREEIAVIEMKERARLLSLQGLPMSPM